MGRREWCQTTVGCTLPDEHEIYDDSVECKMANGVVLRDLARQLTAKGIEWAENPTAARMWEAAR